MNLTHRQLLDVKTEVETSLSWRFFREFLAARALEHENIADEFSADITKLLVREQHAGAAKDLARLNSDFQYHVANITNNTKEE